MADKPKKRGKVPVPGSKDLVDAEYIDIVSSKEPWTEYELSDGSMLKIRSLATEVWRVDNEYDPEGNPMYVVKSAGIMSVTAPESLKRKPPKFTPKIN